MKLKLGLRQSDGSVVDVELAVDGDTTVGELARAVARREPTRSFAGGSGAARPTFARVDPGVVSTPLSTEVTVAESGLRSGSTVALAAAVAGGDPARVAPVALLTVHSGPDAGSTHELHRGVNLVGRGRACRVRLSDPLVSTLHARVVVGEVVEIVDENSSNGILAGGELVPRVELRAGDRVVLGDSMISVSVSGSASIGGAPASTTVEFNRSPRVDPVFGGNRLVAPEPPQPVQPQRFPMIASIVPLLLGGALYLLTKNILSVLFVGLSPLMMLGTWWENRSAARKNLIAATEQFRASLADLVVSLRRSHEEERHRRCIEHPGTADVVAAIDSLTPLLWTRRPEHDSFMEVRLGLGIQPSRTTVELPHTRNSLPELATELDDVVTSFASIDRVPVVGSFDRSGSVGVSGPDDAMLGVARGLVLQVVGLHSPAELVVAGVASARSAVRWEWLKWLPHTASEHSPLQGDHLVSSGPGGINLVAELMELISQRAEAATGSAAAPALPRVLVLVEDDAPVERSQLVHLAEIGPPHGVHLLWIAGATERVPAACRSFVEVDPASGKVGTGRVVEGEWSHPILVEPVDAANAERLARALAPVVDAGALPDGASSLPSAVSFLAEVGVDLALSPDAVVTRWRESNSVHLPGEARHRLRRDNTLRALVGRGASDSLHLDLRAQGPHALVGGTTGAGKSEFLQTWILGMAAAHGPQRVTFLLVDYKGGSAFADCVKLPHSVGLVTDLSPHLVRRALISLNAELRHREHVLNRKKAKDLLELERRGDPDAPPSLVIVVDEFAALVQEVPEFVDGVVNVAQRGRSLGLHLVLATQRPAGVIKDNLRANTNLRVALRMADEDDSSDVVGTRVAASFDPGVPGRAIAKTGPGRLTPFQAGYSGGWTSAEPPPPLVRVRTLAFGPSVVWDEPDLAADEREVDPGPTDIQRLVDRLTEAATSLDLEPPRKPWLPELAGLYDLGKLPAPRTDTELVFGVLDDPDEQRQPAVAFLPDRDGNMAVYGTGGSGKSTFLRSVAIAAGLTARGGPCFVYGLDFGSRGLQMLDPLPHVGGVVGADDHERIARLLRQLRETIDERAQRYAAAKAGTVEEYRRLAGQPDEPRVLVLVDGIGAFRAAYEVGEHSRLFDLFQSIAADGRPVGVHVVVSADRPASVPASLGSTIQQRLVLRLSNDMDLAALAAPTDGFDATSPPGRGFIGAAEVQVGVFGGHANVAEQAHSIERLAESMRRAGTLQAPPVERLAERIELSTLPSQVDGRPTFAVSDETLAPIGLDIRSSMLVVGPASSGRTTALATIVRSVRQARPTARFAYLGQKRSTLATLEDWSHRAVGADEVAELADELVRLIEDDEAAAADLVVVIDGIGDFLNSSADYGLQELLKACRAADVFVVAEGETSSIQGSWPLLQAVKAARHGIVLQPDQMDGDTVFHTSFPRMSRKDFPPGRGMYVRAGHATKVQIALPE